MISDLNPFGLHGKFFRDDENRLTANLAVMLSEARRAFLPAFLALLDIKLPQATSRNVRISLQEAHQHGEVRSILDATVSLDETFSVILESKVGYNSINVEQAIKYARLLMESSEPIKRLAFITQLREPLVEIAVRSGLAENGLTAVACSFLLWQQVFSTLRVSEDLDIHGAKLAALRIKKGLPVRSSERFAYLFLDEVEKMAYDLSVIDDLTVGEVEDVVVQVQWRWFMEVALKYNIWFPPSQSIRGLRPAKYVAYYQTADNDQPKQLTHIARVLKVWRRVSYEDAKVLPEFEHFFSDPELASKVATFKNKEGLFHIALTGDPVLLARPLVLGDPYKAQYLTKKRFPMTRLLAAKTTDDLFLGKERQEPDETS